MTSDSPDLERFVRAQDEGGTYATALSELRAGRKRGHWIWFVLPQLAGLGHSEMSRRYAVSGLPEARAYLRHPVLGPRLHECAEALLSLGTSDPVEVLGSIDAAKVRSSMTLFERAADGQAEAAVFARVLDRFYGGRRDGTTLGALGELGTSGELGS